LIAAALWPGAPASAQQCTPTGTNQTCTNSIFLTGGGVPVGLPANAVGLSDTGATGLTVTNTNSGTISGINPAGDAFGINAGTATVTNFGTISGTSTTFGAGINAGTATVTNFGTISGTSTNFGAGINAGTATVTNFGTISGTGTGGGIGVGIDVITGNITNY